MDWQLEERFVAIDLTGDATTGNEEKYICDTILNLKDLIDNPETKGWIKIQEINVLLKNKLENFKSGESKILKSIHQVFWPKSKKRVCCFPKPKWKWWCGSNHGSFEHLEELLRKEYNGVSGEIQLFPYLFHSQKTPNSGEQKLGILLHFTRTSASDPDQSSQKDSRIYIDSNGRVYNGLYDWLHNNWLPWGYLSYPKDGNYQTLKIHENNVLLDRIKTPGLKNQIVEKVEIVVLIIVGILGVAVWLIEGFPTHVAFSVEILEVFIIFVCFYVHFRDRQKHGQVSGTFCFNRK